MQLKKLCLLVIGRRLLPQRYWFELGILNYGMSTGTTATGLMLLRIIDRGRNPATLKLGEVMVSDPESLPQSKPGTTADASCDPFVCTSVPT